jgi:lysozyme family protein
MSIFFDAAWSDLQYWEGYGNFHRVPGDPGGATKWGTSLRFLKNLPLDEADIDGNGHVNERDIQALTEDQAKRFCRKHFWLHYQLGAIESLPVATKLLNMFFNMRGRTAGRVAQRALASCGIHDVAEDGYIGPLTQAAINDLCCSPDLVAMYLSALRAQQEGVYRLIVAARPQLEKFLAGWLRRARDHKH